MNAGSPSLQEKYSLCFSPAVGDVLLYMMDTSVHLKGKDLSGKEVQLGVTASGEISFDVKRVVGDLVYTALKTNGIVVDAQTIDGIESYTLKTKDGMAVRANLDQGGSVHEIYNLEALNRKRIWNISFDQILRSSLPTLPKTPVAIGETWCDSKQMTLPYQELDLKVSVERNYVLQNVLPSAHGEVALISVESEVLLSGSRNWGELTGRFEGKGIGQGLFNFYVQRGFIQEFKAEYKTDASLILEKGGTTYREWPFHLAVSVSFLNLN